MKKIFVTQPSLPDFEEYISEIKSIWATNHITNFGPKYNQFKNLITERFGYKNVDIQCNGHMTLQNILSCIEPGEIITSPFTFVSTTLAINNSGHTPVFCDIRREDYNIDVNRIEELITENTKAIVPVHVFGSPCDVDRIQELADKYGLKVVYDAAHAFGVKVKGTDIGKFGDASMFSFHATKVFNTIEGGMGVFKDKEMMNECVCRSNFGMKNGVTEYAGVNSKMNEFTAAMGIVNMKHLDRDIERRKIITEQYDASFAEIDEIKLQQRKEEIDYNYAYYPILIDSKSGITAESLLAALEQNEIYARRYFYPAINDIPLFADDSITPVARETAEHIICLPLAAGMEEEDVARVIGSVKEFFENER